MPRSGKVKAAEELPNLERSAIRLDGIEIYSVIGALQAGTSVGLMQEVGLNTLVDPFSYQGQDIDLVWTILSTVFLISGTVATLGGIYSTVIFALCSLYGKTALGMDRDRMYVYFMKNTGELRKRAFTGFTTSLLLFCLQVTLIACFVIYLGKSDCDKLMEAATPIFTNVIPEKDQPKKKTN